MIGNLTKGTNHSNALKYDLTKKDAQLLGTNCSYNDWQGIGKEMETVAASNIRCKNNCLHISMSAPDNEKLTDEQWKQAAILALKELGLENNQYAITRHSDSKHDHIHITVNRIDHQGKAWNNSKDFERVHQSMRAVENALSLQRIEEHKTTRDGRFEDTKKALNDSLKASKGQGLERFKSEMKGRGYSVIENKSQNTGNISGISIKSDLDGKTYKASELRKGGYRGMERQLNDQPKIEQKTANYSGAAGKTVANAVNKSLSKIGSNPLKMPNVLPQLPAMNGASIIKSIINSANQSIKKSRSIER